MVTELGSKASLADRKAIARTLRELADQAEADATGRGIHSPLSFSRSSRENPSAVRVAYGYGVPIYGANPELSVGGIVDRKVGRRGTTYSLDLPMLGAPQKGKALRFLHYEGSMGTTLKVRVNRDGSRVTVDAKQSQFGGLQRLKRNSQAAVDTGNRAVRTLKGRLG